MKEINLKLLEDNKIELQFDDNCSVQDVFLLLKGATKHFEKAFENYMLKNEKEVTSESIKEILETLTIKDLK